MAKPATSSQLGALSTAAKGNPAIHSTIQTTAAQCRALSQEKMIRQASTVAQSTNLTRVPKMASFKACKRMWPLGYSHNSRIVLIWLLAEEFPLREESPHQSSNQLCNVPKPIETSRTKAEIRCLTSRRILMSL